MKAKKGNKFKIEEIEIHPEGSKKQDWFVKNQIRHLESENFPDNEEKNRKEMENNEEMGRNTDSLYPNMYSNFKRMYYSEVIVKWFFFFFKSWVETDDVYWLTGLRLNSW